MQSVWDMTHMTTPSADNVRFNSFLDAVFVCVY